AVRRARETQAPLSIEFRIIRPDGAVRWVASLARIFADETGAANRLVGVNVDITERKEAEQALRAAQEQLHTVTDVMSAPVTLCSRDVRYLWVSKACAQWLGRAPEAFVGRPIVEIIGQEAFDHLKPYFERVLSGEEVHYEEQVNYSGLGPRWI